MNPIFERTSIRQWTDQPVEDSLIDQILKAAMQAPSAVNSQPWEFVVITNPELKQKLSQVSPYAHCAANAPVLLALLCRKENSCPEYNEIDMGICIENILLEVTTLGLGAVCLGIAPEPERIEAMDQLLNVPDTQMSFALIPIGYPKTTHPQVDRYDPNRITWIR